MIRSPLVVTCELACQLAGQSPPMLDAILLCRWLTLRTSWARFTRRDSVPNVLPHFAADRFPIGHTVVGKHVIPHASSPILSSVDDDRHHHFHKRFPVAEAARYCDPNERAVIATTMGITKSYRLPERIRMIERISWIVEGNLRELKNLLQDVYYIGRDRSHGWGAVKDWKVRQDDRLAGAWWTAAHDGGAVLMRPMPLKWPARPANLIGWRNDFAACSPPYWHPRMHEEIVTPC